MFCYVENLIILYFMATQMCIHWVHCRAMSKKDVGLRIRVDRELRNEFLDICRTLDRPASQILREFMRTYIDEYRESQQGVLFKEESQGTQ